MSSGRVILVVRRLADARALFPGGVPRGVETFSARTPLEGLAAGVVLVAPDVDERTRELATLAAIAGRGVVAEVRPWR